MIFIEHTLIIEAIKIEGECPVYEIGDKIVIKGLTIDMENSDAICIHTLFCLGPFIMALREGIPAVALGLSTQKKGPEYFQCLNSGKPYTNGGTVTFKVISSL